MAQTLAPPPEAPVRASAPRPGSAAASAGQRVRHRRADLTLMGVLLVCDFVMLGASLGGAYMLRSRLDAPWLRTWDTVPQAVGPAVAAVPGGFHPFPVYLRTLPFLFAVWAVMASQRGLYTPRRSVSRLTETLELWKTASFTVIFAMAAAYLSKYDYSRTVTLLFWGLTLVLTSIARMGVRGLHRRYLRGGYGTIRTLVYGTGESAMLVVKKMQRYRDLGYEVVGLVDDDPSRTGTEVGGTRILGTADQLIALVRDHGVHEVFIAQPMLGHEPILELITNLDVEGIRYRIVSDSLEALTARVELDGIANIPIVDLKGRRLSWWEAAAKTAMDYGLTALLLLPMLPVMALIAAAIKLDSAGPVMFRQERVGRRGRLFRIFKFRTMLAGCDKFEMAPNSRADPRITRVGKILRRMSLDELPQLFNVLWGDMSLVGPRPEMPFLVHEYKPWQLRRLDVKPGITGLWQILGRKDLPLHGNLEYDFYYIQNRSLLWDVLILIKTIPIVLFGRGAY